MRKSTRVCIAVLSIFLFLFSCASCTSKTAAPSESVEPESTSAAPESTSDPLAGLSAESRERAEKDMAILMEEIALRQAVQFSIDAHAPDILLTASAGSTFKEFSYAGGELVWDVRISLHKPDTWPMGFMVLCDGVPTEFTFVKTGDKMMHLSTEITGSQTFRISFTPEFVSGFGRIDFMPITSPHLNGVGIINQSLTILASLPDGYQSWLPSIPQTLDFNVPRREALSSNIGAWPVFSAGLIDIREFHEQQGRRGTFKRDLSDAETFLLEIIAGESGTYRLVALLDYELFPLFNGEAIIDCNMPLSEMLSLTAPVDGTIPEGAHSFLIIAMKTDGDALLKHNLVTSERTELINEVQHD